MPPIDHANWFCFYVRCRAMRRLNRDRIYEAGDEHESLFYAYSLTEEQARRMLIGHAMAGGLQVLEIRRESWGG